MCRHHYYCLKIFLSIFSLAIISIYFRDHEDSLFFIKTFFILLFLLSLFCIRFPSLSVYCYPFVPLLTLTCFFPFFPPLLLPPPVSQ